MNIRSMGRRLAAGAFGLLGLTAPALAHPHILIDAKVAVVFDANGAVAGLRHYWTFDTAFSAWMIQGLDTNGDRETSPDELQSLADENMTGLADYGFYTYAGEGEALMAFAPSGDQRMVYEDGRTTLTYSVAATEPLQVTSRFELAVYDPEYYVAISFADVSDVTLENAPAGCRAVLDPPRPMDPAVEERLYALGPEVLELPPDLAAAMRGTQGLVAVTCDGKAAAAPVTAVDAVTQVAEARPSLPFGGPPAEPGLNLPRSGFFGWLQDQQRSFYGAMTTSLDALRTDWTAFWVLGGLSFLYGVFHAAGPGHGKVVISSYMLANETQLRRGVTLSVLSALLQSLVAVVFVLIAAGLLGMTSVAMGDAANWIGIASYGLVALLGLWLVARKVFGWGHGHHNHDLAHKAHEHLHADEHDHHDHGHEHPHDHADHDHAHDEHLHVVPPQATTGSLREQLSVVLAVGLRPCSGALVVLVFALSQGLLPAGIAAVFLMGAGTAITVAALATIAVTAKGLASRVGGVGNPLTAAIVWWVELLAAVAVLAFGVLLLIASL
ncbi:HoxN/HupN/NixA family nickel/cobalt transporter [Devosia sp.]|uniref:HoxN/HupN/NixA family nickel/cobalt transporter n=1 Tax=Devosia sp. TaxID=1871048 RepID=UPI002FCA236F